MSDPQASPDIICIGSVLWDIIGRTSGAVRGRGDVAGQITRLPGGVAMNIAMGLQRFGMRPALLSCVGCDSEGDELTAQAQAMGLITRHLHRDPDLPTDSYMAIEDDQGLVAAIADAHSLERAGAVILTPLSNGDLATTHAPWSKMIALDGNLTESLLSDISKDPAFAQADLRIAPASPGKAERLLPLLPHPGATLYVNLQEAGLLCREVFENSRTAADALIESGATRVLVTDGARDASDAKRGELTLTRPAPNVTARRITGAGDTFMAAHLFAESRGDDRSLALERAQVAAAAYVACEEVLP